MNSIGIPQPNVMHRFMIFFVDGENKEIPGTGVLTNQVIRVGKVLHHNMNFGISVSQTLDMVFSDDAGNLTIKALLALPSIFQIKICRLDSENTIIRKTILQECRLLKFTHSELDYAGPRLTTHQLDIRTNTKMGTAINELAASNPIAEAIVTTLSGAQVSVRANDIWNDGISKFTAQFNINGIEYDFNQETSD